MTPSIIFFDLDGTLCDSMPHLVDLFVQLLAGHFDVPEELSRQHVPEILKLTRPEQMAGFAELTGGDFSPDNERGIRYRRELNAGQANMVIAPFPEVAGVLRGLQEQGCRLVLTTNSPLSGLDARLTSAAIREYFTLVLGTDLATGMSKGPDHIRRAGEAFGLVLTDLAEQAVFIGDAEGDMSIAKAAGMIAIGRVTDGNRADLRSAGADYLIDDLRGLGPLLAQLSA